MNKPTGLTNNTLLVNISYSNLMQIGIPLNK